MVFNILRFFFPSKLLEVRSILLIYILSSNHISKAVLFLEHQLESTARMQTGA
jgi:hypothetical protein